MTPKGVWVVQDVLYSPRRVKPGPTAAPRGTHRRAADWGSATVEGLTCISGALSVRSARSPIACLSCRRGPSPSPAPLLRLLLLLQHLRPVHAPSQGWPSVCLSHAGGSPAGPGAGARESGAEVAAAAGRGAGALRTLGAGSGNLALSLGPAGSRRRRRLYRWGRGRGRALSAAGPGPGLGPVGSCRACCSEPRVGRGARAARVGTPRAPGPGRVQVRPPPALPPAPAPTPAPARAPRSAAAWGGSERSEQRAREGGGTQGGEGASERAQEPGGGGEGAAAKPGWGSFFQRTGRRSRSAPAAAQSPGGQREWQRGADEAHSRAGAPALPPCTTQRPSGSQAPASLKPARPAVLPGSVHPFACDGLWPHACACERVCSHVLTGVTAHGRVDRHTHVDRQDPLTWPGLFRGRREEGQALTPPLEMSGTPPPPTTTTTS